MVKSKNPVKKAKKVEEDFQEISEQTYSIEVTPEMEEEVMETMDEMKDRIFNLVEENVEVDEDLIEELVESVGLKDFKLTDQEKIDVSKFATYMIMSDILIEKIEKEGTDTEKMFIDKQEQILRDAVGSKYFEQMPKEIQEKWDEMEDEFM